MFKKKVQEKSLWEWAAIFGATFFSFVLFSPETFQSVPWVKTLADFAAIGGLTMLGVGNVRVVRRQK